MNSNFNMVKKPKKEEVIEEEEDIELEEEVEERKNSDVARKRMFKMMGIIVGGMVILLVVLYIISIFNGGTYSYTEIEKVLKDAAISYFKDNPDSLPTEEGNIVEIDSSNLIVAERMKDLSEYTKEGVSCTATVQVEKSGNEYLYTPYLNCGEEYITEELYKRIKKDDNLVTSGYGLYATNGAYVFRGEKVNNYVKLGDNLWRIVKVTSNNNIVLISEEGVQYDQPWDNRYNETNHFASGFNSYSASRMKEYLDQIYENPSEDNGEVLLTKKDKAKLVSYNLCTGRRSVGSETKDNSEECAEVLQNQKYGLLTLSDYLYASVDPNCVNASSKSCQNYNYLVKKGKSWWLATGDKDDSSNVYAVQGTGSLERQIASNYNGVRPVIYLNSKVLYKSGNGTEQKPYKIK